MEQRNASHPAGKPSNNSDSLHASCREYLLDRNWRLFEAPIADGPDMASAMLAPDREGYDVILPCDVHVPLIAAGVIPEPLEALQTENCAWVEDRSWWFVNRFTLPDGFLEADKITLSLDRMDTSADIFLNGQALGRHRNAFRPFEAEVLTRLLPGENSLVIRLTAGHETVSEEDLGFLIPFVCTEAERLTNPDHPRGDWRRMAQRKPQYVYGWDWGPRLVTCGMGGPVKLVAERMLSVRSIQVQTRSLEWMPQELSGVPLPQAAHLRFDLEIDTFLHISTCEADIQLDLKFGDDLVHSSRTQVCLRSGWNNLTLDACLENPNLWWPNGMGAPNLYTAHFTVMASLPGPAKGSGFQEARVSPPPIRFGIRTEELDESLLPTPTEASRGDAADTVLSGSANSAPERRFQLLVNGEPVFCKGGNWIPSDSLYLRISDEKYRALIAEAVQSDYNMLRIWGGGFYETELFHDLCDENGLLIWQDLMFACSAFPDHLEWFRQECAAEIEHQAKRLRNHPCLVLWSGNNEIHSAFDGWWEGSDMLFPNGGMQVWNYIAPKLLHQLTPNIPFWNSSPYGGLRPGDPGSGDVHHWGECMMSPEISKRIRPTAFDEVTAKFVSEYGYVGPCRLSSIERYHGGAPVVRDGPIWREHNNTFEKDTVLAGIRKHYLDPDNLDMMEYLLYAGLCQGLMYGYSLEALRAKPNCAGAIYWMYNDTWGETGWTTIDYYLQRKISFPFVRRAFAPVKLIVRKVPGIDSRTSTDAEPVTYAVTGINETTQAIHLCVAYGYCRFDGTSGKLPEQEVHLPARSRGVLFTFTVEQASEMDSVDGLAAVIPLGAPPVHPAATDLAGAGETDLPVILPATESHGEFRQWRLSAPTLTIEADARTEQGCSFTVQTDVYAHAVHFGLDERIRLSDEYFDLLPGECRKIVVESGLEWLPETLPVPQSVLMG